MENVEVLEGLLARFGNDMVAEVVDYAILMLDINGTILNWNKGAERIKGYSAGDVIGKNFELFYTPYERAQGIPKLLLRQASTKGSTESQGWRVRKDGTTFWGLVTITALHDTGGKVIGYTKVTKDLTAENKRAQELNDAHERMLMFIKHAPSAMAMFDAAMRYIAVSEQWITDYHLQGVPIVGRSHYEVFPEIGEKWKKIHKDCLAGAVSKCDEAVFPRADGSLQWIAWDVRPWYQAEGVIGGIIMLTTDITARKTAEFERNNLLDILNTASQAARIGSWEIDLLQNKLTWSKITRDLHEVGDDYEPELESAINFYKGDSKERIKHALDNAINLGKGFDLELEIITATGKTLWTRSIGHADMRNGRCVRIYGIFQDIDKQRTMQDSLRLSEETFRGSFEHSAIGMALVSLEGHWLDVNKRVCDITGYTEQELSSITFQDITHPDDLGIDLENLRRLLLGEIETYAIEKRYFHKMGHTVWVLLSVSLVRDAKGSPLHFVSQIEDITERKNAQQNLDKLNRELTAIINSSSQVSIICTDVDGIITHFSKGAERLLGYAAAEVIGRQSPAIFHKQEEITARSKRLSQKYKRDVKGFDVFIEAARQGKADSREWTYVRKDGTGFPVQLVIDAIRDEAGNIKGYLGIATNLTERKAVEEGMRKYAELEVKNREMEQFAYVASHDLQEPLRTISSFASLLNTKYKDRMDDDGKLFLKYMLDSSNRMMELIKGLLYYSRIGKERVLQEVDCAQIVSHVLSDLKLKIDETGALVEVGDLPVISGYALELQVLFQNLISNAIKFVPKGRTPHIKIAAVRSRIGWQFSVKDNGIGIEDKDKSKIFIIFKRLNDATDYEGTGIGLAHCKKIVELHNGNIWVESELGTGSTFNFTLLT